MKTSTILPYCNQLKVHHQPTFDHSIRVARISHFIGKRLQLNSTDLYELNIASCLHDLGKVKIPVEILDKPTVLSPDEWLMIKNHPIDALHILQSDNYPLSEKVCGGIVHHHEHYNGAGYPDGLHGDNIPLFGRIIALSDAIDAMIHTRPYRQTLSIENTVDEIFRCINSQFDPYIVRHIVDKRPDILMVM